MKNMLNVFVGMLIGIIMVNTVFAMDNIDDNMVSEQTVLELYHIINDNDMTEFINENTMEEIIAYVPEVLDDPNELDPEKFFYEPQFKEPVVVEIVVEKEMVMESKIIEPVSLVTEEEKIMMAKVLWHECRSNQIPENEKAAVVWTILNRYDSKDLNYVDYGSDYTIANVITKDYAFAYYNNTIVDDYLLSIVEDVVSIYENEKATGDSTGRTLPNNYYFFHGSGGRNWFRQNYTSTTYYQF